VTDADQTQPLVGNAPPQVDLAAAIATAKACEAGGFPPPPHIQAAIDAADPKDVARLTGKVAKAVAASQAEQAEAPTPEPVAPVKPPEPVAAPAKPAAEPK